MSDLYHIKITDLDLNRDLEAVAIGHLEKYNPTTEEWTDVGMSNQIEVRWMGDINHREHFPEHVIEANRILNYDDSWTLPIKKPPHVIDIDLTNVTKLKLPWCMVTNVVFSDCSTHKPYDMTILEDGVELDVEQYTGDCVLFLEDLNYIKLVPEIIHPTYFQLDGEYNILGVFDENNKLCPWIYDVRYNGDKTDILYKEHRDVPNDGTIIVSPRVDCRISRRVTITYGRFATLTFDTRCVPSMIRPDDGVVQHPPIAVRTDRTDLTLKDKALLHVARIIVPTWFYDIPHAHDTWEPIDNESEKYSGIKCLNYRIRLNDAEDVMGEVPPNPWKVENGKITPIDPTQPVYIPTDVDVDGLVDGRDVSVDGLTLDNHIANHTTHSVWTREERVLTPAEINNKSLSLANTPVESESLIVTTELGGQMVNGRDYILTGSTISWAQKTLENVLEQDDVMVIQYKI